MKTMFTHIPPISIRLTLLVVLSGCATERTMIPTPSLYTKTATPLFGDLAPELRGDRLSILYATDRLPEQHESAKRLSYGSERSPSGALGVAEVRIENGSSRARPGSRPAIEIESVEELVRFPATPYLYRVGDRGRVQIDPGVAAELEQTKAQARQQILKRLALTPKKEVYVDVHGVATRFDQAVLSLAEFWHFLGREGVPIAYTWPAGSKGLIFYTVDRESGEFTVLHLKQFLRFLAGMPEIERIHVTAHSRGTDVVVTALRELVIEARAKGLDPRKALRIENLVLAAADLDVEVMMQRVTGEAMGPAFGRVTIYTNAEDKALAAARSLFKSRQRLGTLEPSELTERQREFVRRSANLEVIVYQGAGGGFFKHGYYDDPAVSSDVLMVLRYGWRPGEGERRGLERLDENTWRISEAHWADDRR